MTHPRNSRLWLVVTALLTAGSCTDASPPSTPGSVPTIEVTLSRDRPSACIRVGDAERVVEFGVDALQNPDQQGLQLEVLANGTIVTVFGVYPPTTPQRFRVRLSSGTYSVDLRSGPDSLAGATSADLQISGATAC